MTASIPTEFGPLTRLQRRVMMLLICYPGLHLTELARLAGKDMGAVGHIVVKLEQKKLIRSQLKPSPCGGAPRRYFYSLEAV